MCISSMPRTLLLELGCKCPTTGFHFAQLTESGFYLASCIGIYGQFYYHDGGIINWKRRRACSKMGRALQSLFARIESPNFGYVSADVKALYGLEMRKLIVLPW